MLEENLIEIKSGIMITVEESVKSIAYVKRILFGILLLLFAKTVNI